MNQKSRSAGGPLLSFEGGVVGSPADQTLPSSVLTVSRSEVVTAERMPFVAVRLPLVGEAPFLRGIQKILALTAKPEVRGIHTKAVIAGVADDAPRWNRPVVQLPRIAMGAHVVPVRHSDPPIAPASRRISPLPAPLGFLDLRPETRNDIHVEQSNTKPLKYLALSHSRSTPEGSGF